MRHSVDNLNLLDACRVDQMEITMTRLPTRWPTATSAGARVMAKAWSDYLSALGRGDSSASAFAEWMASHWEPRLDRPAGLPDARGRLALGGGSVDWYERDGWITGHLTGHEGGYLLSLTALAARPEMEFAQRAA